MDTCRVVYSDCLDFYIVENELRKATRIDRLNFECLINRNGSDR